MAIAADKTAAKKGEKPAGKKHDHGAKSSLATRKNREMQSPAPPKPKRSKESSAGPDGSWDDQGLGMPRHVLDAVVKIYCTHCDPNHSLPWQMRRQTYSTSSGFVISERRILTNAHSVENFTVVKVKKRGCDQKFIAKVLAIGNECDIALLTVEDDSFWEGITDLKPAERLPHLQEAVTVVGFPIGGENISVTAGVVSRVEMQQYCHSSQELLGVQIDAAINSGNSGGPALNSDFDLVGIAFQSLNASDAENIGYIIPWLVVDHFLEDYKRNNKYTGFCSTGFEWQRTENKSLRKAMGMDDNDSGILVKWVDPTSNAHGKLEKGDIVTHFDDVPIANDGTVPYRAGERISFHYLKSLKFVGDNCNLRVRRNGQSLELQFPLGAAAVPLLVPIHEERRMPEYLVVAGFVFVALSERYLRSEYGDNFDREAPVKLLEKFMHGRKKTATEQVVVLSQVLDADVNTGYEYLVNTQVVAFNGTPVENIANLAKLLDNCTDRYLRFDLDYDEVIILDRETALASNRDILAQHGIPCDRSIGQNPKVEAPASVPAPPAPEPESNTTATTGAQKRSAPAYDEAEGESKAEDAEGEKTGKKEKDVQPPGKKKQKKDNKESKGEEKEKKKSKKKAQ